MTLKKYVTVMVAATIFCWVAFGFVLINVDPLSINWLGFIFFYLSLFLALVGTVALSGLFFRVRFNKNDLPIFKLVTLSYRQGVWISLLIIFCLFLQSKGLLTWWNVIILVVFLFCAEFFIMTSRQRKFY